MTSLPKSNWLNWQKCIKQLKKHTLFFAETFREELDHRSSNSCLAVTPGSDTSFFLSLNLSPYKTGLCSPVTNNQEGTGGVTLVPSMCVRIYVLQSSNTVVMGNQISMVWEWSLTHIQRHSDSNWARHCHHSEHGPIIYLPSGGERTYSGTGSRPYHYTTKV